MASIASLPRPAPEIPPNGTRTRPDTAGFSPEYLAEMAAYALELRAQIQPRVVRLGMRVHLSEDGDASAMQHALLAFVDDLAALAVERHLAAMQEEQT